MPTTCSYVMFWSLSIWTSKQSPKAGSLLTTPSSVSWMYLLDILQNSISFSLFLKYHIVKFVSLEGW